MTDFNRNTTKFKGFAFALRGSDGRDRGSDRPRSSGGAAAQGGSGELVNGTLDVTNETESIYVDAVGNDSMNGSGPVSVAVTLEGLTADEGAGNGTVLNETTLSVAAGATNPSTSTTRSPTPIVRRTTRFTFWSLDLDRGMIDPSTIDSTRLRRDGAGAGSVDRRLDRRSRLGIRRLDRHGRASRSSRCDRRGARGRFMTATQPNPMAALACHTAGASALLLPPDGRASSDAGQCP